MSFPGYPSSPVEEGQASVGGYQPAKLKVYQDLIDQKLLRSPQVLSMMNVKYILSSQNPNHPAFTQVAPGIYEFHGAQPRAWFVPAWRSLPDEASILRVMGGRDFDPASIALFPQAHAPSIAASGLPVREVTVESDDERGLRLRVGEGDGPGLLIVSDIYYAPGWRATIDGNAVPILQANHVLRGVEVPAGAHVIEMRIESRGYRIGRLLNRIGGLALLLLAGIGLLQARQERMSSR